MDFFGRINAGDFETLNIFIINANGKEIGSGIYPVEAVMEYNQTLDIDYHGTSLTIDCTNMVYDEKTDTYTVSDGGVVFKMML